MRRRYYAAFRLGRPDREPPGLEEVFTACRDWVFHPRRELQEPKDFKFEEGVNRREEVGEGTEIHLRGYREGGEGYLGFRFEHPDRENTDRRWRTDICAVRGDANSLACAVTLYAGHLGMRIAPGELPISRPGVVPMLADRLGAYANQPIVAEPKRVDHAGEFLTYLGDPDRNLPVVFISTLNANDRPVVDAERIASQLVGIAHVHVAENRFISFDLTDLVGRSLSCWNGALRVYWPGFTKSSNPFDHRLWTPRNLVDESRSIETELLHEVVRTALNRLPPEYLRWETYDRYEQRRRFQRLREEGEFEQLLEAADALIEQQAEQITSLEQELQEVREERESERRKAESYRDALLAVKKGERDDEDVATIAQAPPTDIREAVIRVSEEFENRIAFALNSRSEVDGNPYADVESFHGALRFLATTYWEARTGSDTSGTPDLDHACREECGFTYRSGMSKITMGQYQDYYQTEWKGERVSLAAHLGKGSSKDPRHTIRIAFHWDEDSGTVVVGYIGQHQRTRAT